MKRLVIASLLIVMVALAACSPTFPLVQDTRPPTPTAEPAPLPTFTPTVILVPTVAPTDVPTPCLIKGTAASHLYHLPGQLTYKRTQVIAERGDKWFCSEAEAQAAGFTKAKK